MCHIVFGALNINNKAKFTGIAAQIRVNITLYSIFDGNLKQEHQAMSMA